MGVTIKDVAKASNVSVATVSRVLNKHSNVSDETVEKVTKVMEEMGYSPNCLGRDLRKSETKRILAIIAATEQSFYSDVLRGMDEAAFAQGYDVLIATTHDNPEHEMHLLKNAAFPLGGRSSSFGSETAGLDNIKACGKSQYSTLS